MSSVPSTSTSHSNFVSIFNSALETYTHKTKKDLTSHPLLPNLQSCNSPEAILTVLREQIPTFSQFQNGDDRLTKWVSPTVNVLHSFSAIFGGHSLQQTYFLRALTSSSWSVSFIVLLCSQFDTQGSQAAKDAGGSQDNLIDLFNRIECFFGRLEIYTEIPPTAAMRDIIVRIMVEVLTILAIATNNVKRGRWKRFLRKLTGNRDIEDSLERLDKLTQEEVRMASAELLRITHSVERGVQEIRHDVQDVGDNVSMIGCITSATM
ncbi:hypothetical protein BJV77DRAFT_1152577 [Russula vinacea]|nr:hypothetical protein BJV77DRAFT_1152577 [Russula vinacea]